MEREPGSSKVEKKRQRDAIENQVRRYLESGGSITMLDSPGGTASRAAVSSGWSEDDLPVQPD